jgi:hypothetical protein
MEMKVFCWTMANPYLKVQETPQTCKCTTCLHTSRTSFSFELSMACASIECPVLESSECGSSGQFFFQGLVV